MKTVIAVHMLAAALLILAGAAWSAERDFDVNAYQVGSDRIVGRVRHLVTEEQANQFLEGLRPSDRSNGLYYLKAVPSKEAE